MTHTGRPLFRTVLFVIGAFACTGCGGGNSTRDDDVRMQNLSGSTSPAAGGVGSSPLDAGRPPRPPDSPSPPPPDNGSAAVPPGPASATPANPPGGSAAPADPPPPPTPATPVDPNPVPAAAEGPFAGNPADPALVVRGEVISRKFLLDRMWDWYSQKSAEEIIMRVLMDQEQRRLGIEVSSDLIERRIDLQVRLSRDRVARDYGRDVPLESVLGLYGETVESFRGTLRGSRNFLEQIVLEQIVAYHALTDERVEVQQITVQNRTKAEDILGRLKKGSDFARLAREESEVPMGREEGGKVPPFVRGLSPFGGEFDKTAFALAPGELSGVVATPKGYHILKSLARSPGRRGSYLELRADVQELLENSQFSEADLFLWIESFKELNRSQIELKLKLPAAGGDPSRGIPAPGGK